MTILLTIEDDDRTGSFKRLGTHGRMLFKGGRRATLSRAAFLSERNGGRAVQVEEFFDDRFYGDPNKTWIYHCACDLDSPCDFHASH